MVKVKNPGEPAGKGEISRDQAKQLQREDTDRRSAKEQSEKPDKKPED